MTDEKKSRRQTLGPPIQRSLTEPPSSPAAGKRASLVLKPSASRRGSFKAGAAAPAASSEKKTEAAEADKQDSSAGGGVTSDTAQLQQLHQVFNLLLPDEAETIGADNLVNFLKKLGHAASTEKLQKRLREITRGKSDRLSFVMFVRAMENESLSKSQEEQELSRVFTMLDPQATGLCSMAAVKHQLTLAAGGSDASGSGSGGLLSGEELSQLTALAQVDERTGMFDYRDLIARLVANKNG